MRELTHVIDRVRVVAAQPVVFRVILVLLALIQLAGVHSLRSDSFSLSYWYVDYAHGFVRRGLGGQLIGDSSTARDWAISASIWIPLVAVVVLVELLVRKRTQAANACALLLVSSPFCLDQLFVNRRPDQFGLAVLVATGLAALYVRRNTRAVFALLGLVLAVLVFVHEATLLIWGVFGLPVIFLACAAPLRERVRLAVIYFLPACLAFVVVMVFGMVTMSVALQMQKESGLPSPTVFHFLAYGVSENLHQYQLIGQTKHLRQLTIGIGFVALHLWWIRSWIGLSWSRMCRGVPAKVQAIVCAALVVAVAAVFATGVDWLRWFSDYGTACLVVVAVVLLRPLQPIGAALSRAVQSGAAQSGTVRAGAEKPLQSAVEKLGAASPGTVRLPFRQVALALYFAMLVPLHPVDPAIPIPDLGRFSEVGTMLTSLW